MTNYRKMKRRFQQPVKERLAIAMNNIHISFRSSKHIYITTINELIQYIGNAIFDFTTGNNESGHYHICT